jgi:hypothetical protein
VRTRSHRPTPFHSNPLRTAWARLSSAEPAVSRKKLLSLPHVSAFSTAVPRKVTFCRHVFRETVPSCSILCTSFLCKAPSGPVRNPDAGPTGGPNRASAMGSYRRSPSNLRRAIHSSSASWHHCGRLAGVFRIPLGAKSWHSLVHHGQLPSFSRFVRYRMLGLCAAPRIAVYTRRNMSLSSCVRMARRTSSTGARTRHSSVQMIATWSSWIATPRPASRPFATSGLVYPLPQ